MISIVKATFQDAPLLAKIGQQTFMESHGKSAPEKDLHNYMENNLSVENFKNELADTTNIYHIIYYNKQTAGYSKIILNTPNKNLKTENITKLERFYILREFYNLKLGYQLFLFNINLAKQNSQSGLWLNVWTENKRAINFYKKTGFKIIGEYLFKISTTHSNPNYQLFLAIN